MPDLPTMTLVWIAVALGVGLVIEVLSFWAGCILADAPSPGYRRGLALAVPLYLAWGLGLLWVLVMMGGMFTAAGAKDPWSTQSIILVVVASLVANALLAAFAYPLVLGVSLKNGAFVALTEVLLRALLGALVIGAVLVALAIYQVANPRVDEPGASGGGPPVAQRRVEPVPFAPVAGTRSVPRA